MSAKTERPQVRTAQDLERKYNFSAMESNSKMAQEGIVEVKNDLYNLINVTLPNLETQIDGKVETYFYSGVPTLLNYPASSWSDFDDHIGDLYYDKDTGKTYIFNEDSGVYSWENIMDDEITDALAYADAAQDTADNKNQIFMVEPYPPYQNGDLWLNNGELYVCQISRDSGSYTSGDFIAATNYANKTQAQATADALVVLQGKVTTTTTNTYKKDEIEKIIEGTGFNYVITEDATYQSGTDYYRYIPLYDGSGNANLDGDTYKLLIPGTDYTIGDAITGDIYVRKTITVQQVKTASATFDENGMHYEKTGSQAKSTINQLGLQIKGTTTNEEMLFAGYVEDNRFGELYKNKTIVYTKNLVTKGYTSMANVVRFEQFNDSYNGTDYPTGLGVFLL